MEPDIGLSIVNSKVRLTSFILPHYASSISPNHSNALNTRSNDVIRGYIECVTSRTREKSLQISLGETVVWLVKGEVLVYHAKFHLGTDYN